MGRPEIIIEQVLYRSVKPGEHQLLARSAGFRDHWLPEAQRLCACFGQRPAGAACPSSVFARPLGKSGVAVVQVADLENDSGNAYSLGFRFLIVGKNDYQALGGDPFLIAEQFPPAWTTRGTVPTLTWPGTGPPRRTVEEVQRLLQLPGASATLLGGCQALLDGCRLVFERSEPDPELLRGLWTLLPTSSRCNLWPASFAFGNVLGFDAVVVPRATDEEFEGYLTEQQAGDYPEGRYELALQIAAEAGDQRDLDVLLARRSRTETWRMGAFLLGVILLLLFVSNVLFPNPRPRARREPPAAARPGTQPGDAAVKSVPP